MYDFKVAVINKSIKYTVPIKWFVKWLEDNTSYESMSEFSKKASSKERDDVYKSAKKSGVIYKEEKGKTDEGY